MDENFQNLPFCVIESICNHLHPKDVVNLILTNSAINRVICSSYLKLHLDVGVKKYTNHSFGRHNLTKVNFRSLIERSEKMISAQPNWKLRSVEIHLAKLKAVDDTQICDIKANLPQFLKIHDRLTCLLIEASANYDDGPFQLLDPSRILQSCPYLKTFRLLGRKQTTFDMWGSTATVLETGNPFCTSLQDIELSYIVPINLPELLSNCPTMKRISIADHG